ncbi:MAG TPA: hypothetical protein VF173_32150 [Thermoanaerobaculia bacterium]|nr:hypothetical protein [Thermoanaerobaculia bacterium]
MKYLTNTSQSEAAIRNFFTASQAGHLFDAVRHHNLACGHLPEATQATIEHGMALTRQGRGAETPSLAIDLVRVFADQPGLDLSLAALLFLGEERGGDGPGEEAAWSYLWPAFLLSFRLLGVSPQPVAFV